MHDGPANFLVFAPSQSCCDMPKFFWQLSATGDEKFLYLEHVCQVISATDKIDCDLCDISTFWRACHVPYFYSKILFQFHPKLWSPTPKFRTKFWPENLESHSKILHPSPQPHSKILCQIPSWNSDISLWNSIFFYQVHFRSILTFLTTFISLLARSSWFPYCMIIYPFRGLLLFLLPLFPIVLVFKSPVLWTRKKPDLDWTGPEKTGLLVAVH